MVEGLFCGCRPLTYNRVHYKKWFEQFSYAIDEIHSEGISNSIKTFFQLDIEPVTKEEREKAVEIFNWEDIVKGFWKRIRI